MIKEGGEMDKWNDNYYNLKTLDIPIYRVMSYQRLMDCISDNYIDFRNPRKWKDPCESLYLNAQFKMYNEDTDKYDLATFSDNFNIYYGSCWSAGEESYEKWAIYSGKEQTLQINVNLSKLIDALKIPELYVGRVGYLDYEALKKQLSNENPVKNIDCHNKDIIKLFFYKRKEYEFEKEIRIIVQEYNKKNKKSISKKIAWKNIIDEVIISPYVKEDRYNQMKNELSKKGIVNCKKSNLMEVPQIVIYM